MTPESPLDKVVFEASQQVGVERAASELAIEPSVTAAKEERGDPDLDPAQLAARMNETVRAEIIAFQQSREFTEENLVELSETIVRKLLLLVGSKGRKLVFTRFDLMQIFAIWNRKLAGEDRVR